MPEIREISKEIIEKEEKFGRNVFQRDFYFRHGKRLPSGELAPEGFEQAKRIGEKLETTEKGPKPYHSEVKRTADFAKAIQEATKSNKEYKARVRPDIGIKGIMSQGVLNKWREIEEKQGPDAGLQWYLDFGDKKPDEKSISPQKRGIMMARHILEHIKMPEHYYSGSKVDLINVSHELNLGCFIAIALREQIEKDPVIKEGKTFVEKMGGNFKPGEGFEIDTYIDKEGKKTIKVKLRGKEYDLKEEELEELILSSEKKREE